MEPRSVDSRFLQANERTMLAWLRTGLGFLGFGLLLARGALEEVGRAPADAATLRLAGVLLMVLGPTCALLGAYRYHRVHQALLAREDVRLGTGPAIALALLAATFGIVLTWLAAAG
jgi:uncharacterized membrane protein YidH (DUF202 family)